MKISVGHDNWLNLDFENITESTFDIEFSIKTPIQHFSFQQAADYTANLIKEKYKNLHLCLSGGLDSEFVATVLLRNNIAFNPVILMTPLNNAEVWYAFKFCNTYKLDPIILDYTNQFDYDKLLKQIYNTSIKINSAPNVSLIPNVIAKIIKGADILLGSGECCKNCKDYNEPLGEIFEFEKHDFHLDLEFPNRHPGSFFTYTPEIFLAFVQDIDITKTSQEAKAELYGVLTRSKTDSIVYQAGCSEELKRMVMARVEKMNWTEAMISLSREEILKKLAKID